jgi:preprotein translocase subunit SecB
MSKEIKEDPNMSKKNNVFAVQRIYLKDASFEAPSSPSIFSKEWAPELNVELDTKQIEGDFWEASIKISTKVVCGSEVAFVCEIEQAGIFTMSGFGQDQIDHLCGSICPEILYPFAREAIADLVSKGGFPQLLLAPINFEAFYQEKKKK